MFGRTREALEEHARVIERLQDRVRDLERQVRMYEIRDYPILSGPYPSTETVLIKEVVRDILRHLKLNLIIHDAAPIYSTLEPKETK